MIGLLESWMLFSWAYCFKYFLICIVNSMVAQFIKSLKKNYFIKAPVLLDLYSKYFLYKIKKQIYCNFILFSQDQSVPDPIRPRSNSNQFKSAKRPIGTRQRNSLSISNPLLASQLSKSAPVKTLPIEKMIWSRRDPR